MPIIESEAQSRADIMHGIEARHFGRCLDQLWGAGRRTLIELMDYPKARCQAIVVKHYESAVPRSTTGKPWPELSACYVYVPIDDKTNTWTGLDEALEYFEAKAKADAIKAS